MDKEKKLIDQFFRESLGDHQIVPSARAKEAFLKEASGITRRDPVLRRILPYLALAVLIITGVFIIWYTLEEDPGQQGAPGMQQTQKQPIDIQQTKAVDHTKSESSTREPALDSRLSAESAKPSSKVSPVGSSADHSIKTKPQQANAITSSNTNFPKSQTKQYIIPASGVTPHNGFESSAAGDHTPAKPIQDLNTTEKPAEPQPGEKTIPVTPLSVPLQDTIINKQIPQDTLPPVPDSLPAREKKKPINREWYLSMAAQYSPEYMFNTLENNKFINNFGFEGMFIFGNYSVRTGVCFSIGKGTNELAIEYNDFLGSYQKLDSMSFSWDGTIHNYVPSYYLSNQDVWDSLMKIDSLKVVKRYTYLQIPLVLGFDFIHSGRLSVGVRAGPLLSILINSKQLSAEYDPGKKKIIQVNTITPGQVDLNWQVMAGINATLRVSRRILFELEPMAKYYFNSVYEKADISKKPWSIGIRAAVTIKIN